MVSCEKFLFNVAIVLAIKLAAIAVVNGILTFIISMALARLFRSDDRFPRICEVEFYRSDCGTSSISIANHDSENWGSFFGLRDRFDEWKIEGFVFDDLGRSITWFRPTEEVGTIVSTGSIHQVRLLLGFEGELVVDLETVDTFECRWGNSLTGFVDPGATSMSRRDRACNQSGGDRACKECLFFHGFRISSRWFLVLHGGNQVRDERLYCGSTNISKNGKQNRALLNDGMNSPPNPLFWGTPGLSKSLTFGGFRGRSRNVATHNSYLNSPTPKIAFVESVSGSLLIAVLCGLARSSRDETF